jgi:hypothetical protein
MLELGCGCGCSATCRYCRAGWGVVTLNRVGLLFCVLVLQVCTFSTPNHIAWMVPIMPQSYYLTG